MFFLFTAIFSYSQNSSQNLDSIYKYRKLSKDTDFSIDKRINYAKKAIELSIEVDRDSTLYLSNLALGGIYSEQDDFEGLKQVCIKNLKLATKLKDTNAIAFSNYNLGWAFDNQVKYDSAYYHYYNALKAFNTLNDIENKVGVLLNMANIQETERDYIGCETNAIEAISLTKQLPESNDNFNTLWSLHNLIGIVSGELQLYDKAIEYHEKALSFSSQMTNDYTFRIYSSINIASIYKRQGYYQKYYDEIVKALSYKNIKQKDPFSYSVLLGELAYAKFKLQKDKADELSKTFKDAEKLIIENDDEKMVLMGLANYMAEFYLESNKKDSALIYANKAYDIGIKTNSIEAILESLVLKSKITSGKESKSYLEEHIKLNDSLINRERSIRNKFALIEFETREIELKNEQIAREKLWLMILSGGLLMTIVFIYIIVTQRNKNKQLQFNQKQQEANEEIYNLMLSQQDNIEEARTLEKKRISEELHDGILGRLFGTRLSLDSLNFNTSEEAIKTRSTYIDELKTIEQEIRKVSHDLNTDFISGSGFIDIIKTLVETQTLAYQLKYKLKHDDEINWDDISNKTKIHIYRIIQESLQNIYKHAQANYVKISFELKKSVIWLTIEDDGLGFDTSKAKKGIGIKNINSRVDEINGILKISSKINIGTAITIQVPLN